MRIALALGLLTRLATASPRLEVAARIGPNEQLQPMDYIENANTGADIYVESEVGCRLFPWLAVGAFAGFNKFRDVYASRSYIVQDGPALYGTTWGNEFFDVGLRLRFFVGPAFVGLGYGHDWWRSNFDSTCVGTGCDEFGGPHDHSTDRRDEPLYELHAGYTFHKLEALHGGATQLIAIAADATPGNTAQSNDYRMRSLRFLVGLTY
jgi:hypothetical protein